MRAAEKPQGLKKLPKKDTDARAILNQVDRDALGLQPCAAHAPIVSPNPPNKTTRHFERERFENVG